MQRTATAMIHMCPLHCEQNGLKADALLSESGLLVIVELLAPCSV